MTWFHSALLSGHVKKIRILQTLPGMWIWGKDAQQNNQATDFVLEVVYKMFQIVEYVGACL